MKSKSPKKKPTIQEFSNTSGKRGSLKAKLKGKSPIYKLDVNLSGSDSEMRGLQSAFNANMTTNLSGIKGMSIQNTLNT